MRILRWIIILSSIAYWYSIFAMEGPSKKRPLEPNQEITKEESEYIWPELPLEQFYLEPPRKDLSQEEIVEAVSNIITLVDYSPSIAKAIERANNLLLKFPEIKSDNGLIDITKKIGAKFKISWLYVATKIQSGSETNPLIYYLNTTKYLPSDKFKAIETSIKLNDLHALQSLLHKEDFKNLFKQHNYGKHDVILADLAKEKNFEALKILLDAGANPNSIYMDKVLLQNAFPNLKILSMLIEKGARNKGQCVFLSLLGADPLIKSNSAYYPTLLTFIRSGAQVNWPEPHPLIIAASKGDVTLFKWLLDQGADPLAHIKWENKDTTPKALLMFPIVNFPNKQAILDLINKPK